MKISGKYGKILIFALLVIGIALFSVGYFSGNEKSPENEGELMLEQQYAGRLEEMLSGVDGIGRLKVMVSCERDGEEIMVRGVAVLCSGGNDPRVIKDVIGIVEAICGVPSNRVYVAYMKN